MPCYRAGGGPKIQSGDEIDSVAPPAADWRSFSCCSFSAPSVRSFVRRSRSSLLRWCSCWPVLIQSSIELETIKLLFPGSLELGFPCRPTSPLRFERCPRVGEPVRFLLGRVSNSRAPQPVQFCAYFLSFAFPQVPSVVCRLCLYLCVRLETVFFFVFVMISVSLLRCRSTDSAAAVLMGQKLLSVFLRSRDRSPLD